MVTIMPYIRRAAKLYPDFVLGTGSEPFSKAVKSAVKNRGEQSYLSAVWDGTKKGVKEAELHNAQMKNLHGGFWKATWRAIKTTPQKAVQGWKIGGRIADKAGKTGLAKLWSRTKGVCSGLGKRMPLLGTLMIAVSELPNIFSAFKDKGIIGGVAETGKAGLRLGGATVAGAIGQALIPIPFVGGLIGFVAGDMIMSKIVGKSHSEEKAETLAQAEEAEQQAQLLQQQLAQQYGPMYAQNQFGTQSAGMAPTLNQQQLMALQQQLYGSGNAMNDDFMANATGMNKLNYQV